MPPTTTNNATGLFLRKIFPEHEHCQRDASDRERCGIGFVQMLEEAAAVLPEISVGTMNAEELRQLCAGQEQRHAAFETRPSRSRR